MNLNLRKGVMALLAIGFLALTGCASVPMASADLDQQGKTFAAPSGKARIYLYRNESFGAAMKMPVTFDGKTVGQTAAKTYFFWDVEPGKHSLASLTENTPKLDVDAKANGVYYVWQEVKMGVMSARSDLRLVDEATGKKGVEQCKLAQAQTY